jgi:DNA-binding NarL/FixJ family response regulator
MISDLILPPSLSKNSYTYSDASGIAGIGNNTINSPTPVKNENKSSLVRIAIVDDDPAYTTYLKKLLGKEANITLVGLFNSGNAILQWLEANEHTGILPDLILMDMDMSLMDGISCTERIYENYVGIKVLIMAVFATQEKLFAIARSGASGYLLKDANPSHIIKTIYETVQIDTPHFTATHQLIPSLDANQLTKSPELLFY